MHVPADLRESEREALDHIRYHPTTHHADWDAVILMLKRLANVELSHAGNVAVVRMGDERLELAKPRSGPLPERDVLKIRRMLGTAGLLG
ncbi:hypothetical protein [Leifsonia sp. 22587]|uniref:hypothetical protein n=1 Tax=Leifsonia sp. 22587 TaxID=3453946 RepID=UPI003F827473